jgi:mono/diheme cytochrome c family protein
MTRRRPSIALRRTVPTLIFAAALAAPAAAFLRGRDPDVQKGRALYVQHCASCHGADLEGQPDWRSPDEHRLYPAPPHDETGHTWHHDDAMLIDYITRGGQAVLDDMGVSFTSGMPGFKTVLSDDEIVAILDYIKSTWPERVREIQAQRTNGVPVD